MTGITQPNKSLNPYDEPVAVGQLYINDSENVIRIREIKPNATGTVVVHYDSNWRGEWSSYGSQDLSQFEREIEKGKMIRLFGSPEEEMEKALAMLVHLDRVEISEEQIDSETTALAARMQKADLQNLASAMEARKRDIEKARRLIERKRKQMFSMVSTLSEKIAKIRRVIEAFELYLGIYEDIVQLRDGAPAPVETPLSLRQMVLYMDEEIGDPRPNPKTGQPGIDWASVEDFDAWLLQGNHLESVLPESKGVVVLKPSRQRRSYSENPWINALIGEKNSYAYLLIRNGEQVWRIFTNTQMGKRLFPTVQEMTALIDALEGESYFGRQDAEDAEFVYRRNALILQGLMDRTEVFQPLPHPIKIGDPATYADGSLALIRDGENILNFGRPPFWDWVKEQNAKIAVGSRVFVSEMARYNAGYRYGKDFSDRFLRYYAWDSSYPALPKDGVYAVEDHSEKDRRGETTHKLVIRYNPGDTVEFSGNWEYDPHTRKNRVTLVIKPTDSWLINYDQIDLEDIEFYLQSRVDREAYLSMIPVLWGLRDRLLEERQNETHFVALVAARLETEEARVWEAVAWWKFKNKWKRPISQDDAKALRMIEARLQQPDLM